jgi:iron complex transport system substrate-binding protein
LVASGDEFGASLSSERTSDLDAVDVTVWLGLTKDEAVSGVYEQTSAFKDGRFVDIDDAVTENYAVAHSFVSPLSIPYVLERFVPQLAAAVDGDPATEVPAVTD